MTNPAPGQPLPLRAHDSALSDHWRLGAEIVEFAMGYGFGLATVRRYIRDGNLFRDNAAEGLGL